jgi:hypothetical protein
MSISLILVISGCGATAPAKKSTGRVEPASSGSGYDFRKEGKIPPPAGGSARPETDVEEMPVSDSNLEVSEADAPRDTVVAPAPAAAGAVVDGFRVQLFATADRDVAQNARAVAEERLGMPVYLDLDGGVYKIRAGDFVRREDADAALPLARAQFYPDAWVVPAKVNVPRR